ncbi:MAG: hypothetical protein ACTSWI_02495 [Alphaproteobacteria bacterium]
MVRAILRGVRVDTHPADRILHEVAGIGLGNVSMSPMSVVMPGVIVVGVIVVGVMLIMIAVIPLAGGINGMLMCFAMMASFAGLVSLLSLFEVGHSLVLLHKKRIPRVDA